MKKSTKIVIITLVSVVAVGAILWCCWLGWALYNFQPEPIKSTKPSRSADIQTAHEVKKGDTLFALSLRYAVHIADIRKTNGFPDDRDLLTIGQTLLIPKSNLEAYEGVASWYGPGFHGNRMSNGEVYDQNKILVAHRDWPLGTRVMVVNLDNDQTVIATVKDRGPYPKDKQGNYTRDIDCSLALAEELDFLKAGLVNVRIIPLAHNIHI